MWNRPSIFIRIPFSSKVQIAQVPSFFLPIRNPVSPLIFDFSLSEIFLKSNYPSLFSSVSKFLFHFSTRNTQSSFYFYSIRDVNAFYLDQSSDDPKTLSSFFHPTFSPSIRNLCNESLESRRFSRPGENRETFFQTWPSFCSSLLIARNASLFGACYTFQVSSRMGTIVCSFPGSCTSPLFRSLDKCAPRRPAYRSFTLLVSRFETISIFRSARRKLLSLRYSRNELDFKNVTLTRI